MSHTLEDVKDYIARTSKTSKVYIGCDSDVVKKGPGVWFADYYLVVVIHHNGRNGCKIFGFKESERDFTIDKKKPRHRLMMEVYKAVELFLELEESIGEREVEIHLDINPNKKYSSSLVIQEAIGYVKSVCDLTPKVKPEAFAASYCADRMYRAGETFNKIIFPEGRHSVH